MMRARLGAIFTLISASRGVYRNCLWKDRCAAASNEPDSKRIEHEAKCERGIACLLHILCGPLLGCGKIVSKLGDAQNGTFDRACELIMRAAPVRMFVSLGVCAVYACTCFPRLHPCVCMRGWHVSARPLLEVMRERRP